MDGQDGRSKRAEHKRAQILGAARTLFVASGFAATSMDAVVAKAGVSKQTLYRYFPSKTDLLVSVLADQLSLTELAQAHMAPMRSLDDVRDALLRIERDTHAQLVVRAQGQSAAQ